MKILFLGYEDCSIIDFLRADQNDVVVFSPSQKIDINLVNSVSPDIIISFGYKYIIKPDIIEKYKDKIINLHISLLPWNRGYYPILWSIIDNTPIGVTIHLIDSGIDTGDVLLLQEVQLDNEDTLKTAYLKIKISIEQLFIANWHKIKRNEIKPSIQTGNFSYHTKKEGEKILQKLPKLWDTRLKDVRSFRD